MNRIDLTGRLTATPELKTGNGTEVVRFTVAVNRNYKNPDGVYEADFITCKAFSKTAATISNYFNKGDLIEICGRLQVSQYTNKNGDKATSYEVIVESFGFLSSKAKKEDTVDPKDSDPFLDTDSGLPF